MFPLVMTLRRNLFQQRLGETGGHSGPPLQFVHWHESAESYRLDFTAYRDLASSRSRSREVTWALMSTLYPSPGPTTTRYLAFLHRSDPQFAGVASPRALFALVSDRRWSLLSTPCLH